MKSAGYSGGRFGSGSAAGVLLGLGAGLLWGMVFVAPQLLPSFSAAEVALGRYLFYGLASAGILSTSGLASGGVRRAAGGRGGVFRGHGGKAWLVALGFAFAGNVGYYLFVVLAIRLAGASVTTLVIGTLPVTVALVGNLIGREFPFRRLLAPMALILLGLVAINVFAGEAGARAAGDGRVEEFIGLLFALGALTLWTLYGVANARFLKANPRISGSEWSTMVGVATLVLVALAVPLTAVLAPGALDPGRFADPGASLARFVAVSAFLGVVVSWGGTLLWNGASALLPTALAGQLIVSETVAGLAYVFVADGRVPSAPELVGISAVVAGVLVGVRRTRSRTFSREGPTTAEGSGATGGGGR
jgi:drug/metabolite transporter (DMT)-like permease